MRDIRERAFEFACRVIWVHRDLTRKRGTDRVARINSFGRAGIGANLEEAEAAQSRPDFITKNRIALKEAREAHYWLRLICATEMLPPQRIQTLVDEADEIVAILTSIVKKASQPARNHDP